MGRSVSPWAEDMNKAQVGISSVWWEGNPCNMHLMDLALRVKEGVLAEDMVGRASHSSTFQLNVSAFCGIGTVSRGY